jgi:hypothetical protein
VFGGNEWNRRPDNTSTIYLLLNAVIYVY